MQKRFVTIWFRHLVTDWMIIKDKSLKNKAFVIVVPDHGRMIINEASVTTQAKGIQTGMIAADAKIILPNLQVFNEKQGLADKLLQSLCKWCIRFTPITAIEPPDGLTLEVTGCTHLWNDEATYIHAIVSRLQNAGYHVSAAMADTIGTAWAVTRFGQQTGVIESRKQTEALQPLPTQALRLNHEIVERLYKLGLTTISSFITMLRSALRRRFGDELLLRLDEALGAEEEFIEPLITPEPFSERLHCLEPIATLKGIEIALQRLLETICNRLQKEGKGLRTAVFNCYRLDGKIEQVSIGTNHASNTSKHLFKLFELKLETIEPDPGIELFILEAPKTENVHSIQETFWNYATGLNDPKVAEFLDRVTNKFGDNIIHRYLPDEHHWPERSVKPTSSLKEKPAIEWQKDKPRPVHLLHEPQLIEVMAPIPDYPPIHFRYKGTLHTVKKSDGPERIEREWWIEEGLHRDYYTVEDEEGKRYWVFRSGHYDNDKLPS